jgi:hypothetical protein
MDSDARSTLELFNRISVVVDVLLVMLFLTAGLFGLTLLMPVSYVINLVLQSVATLVFLLFGVASLKGAEHITNLIRANLVQAVEDQKTDEEKAAPVVVSKKSIIAAEPSPAPTLTNRVLKTTKVVLKSSKSSPPTATVSSREAVVKRGRPKKDN